MKLINYITNLFKPTLVTVARLKIVTDKKLFRKGQKVWAQRWTGDGHVRVRGKYRGWGRHISVWLDAEKDILLTTLFVEVLREFAQRHDLEILSEAEVKRRTMITTIGDP